MRLAIFFTAPCLLVQLTATISYWAPIPDMTYSVFGGTLNLAQSINLTSMSLHMSAALLHF